MLEAELAEARRGVVAYHAAGGQHVYPVAGLDNVLCVVITRGSRLRLLPRAASAHQPLQIATSVHPTWSGRWPGTNTCTNKDKDMITRANANASSNTTPSAPVAFDLIDVTRLTTAPVSAAASATALAVAKAAAPAAPVEVTLSFVPARESETAAPPMLVFLATPECVEVQQQM